MPRGRKPLSQEELARRWYKRKHWLPTTVTDHLGRELRVWYPPDDWKQKPRELRTHKRKPRRKLRWTSDTPHTWLSMLTAWYHLRHRGVQATGRGNFTLDQFLDHFFADWGRASEILREMATFDQSEIMKHFEIHKLHVRTLANIQRARAGYLASQAAREPDPLAED